MPKFNGESETDAEMRKRIRKEAGLDDVKGNITTVSPSGELLKPGQPAYRPPKTKKKKED